MSMSEILGYKNANNPENIDQNDVNKRWSSICSQYNKTFDAGTICKATECRTCKITMSTQNNKCESSYNRFDAYPTIRQFDFSCTIRSYDSHYSKNFIDHTASHEKINKLIQENRSNANDDSMADNIDSKSSRILNKYKVLKYFVRYCPQCNTTFENNLFGKIKITDSYEYECYLCKTRVLLQCLKCNIMLKDVQKMREHLFTRCALKITYKCPECDYETAYKCNLKEHTRRWHVINDPKFRKCPKCDKHFQMISDFIQHSKTCDIEQYDYHCDHCAFETKSKDDMRIHIQKHMNTSPVKVKTNSKYDN